jgi:hypothetical protein
MWFALGAVALIAVVVATVSVLRRPSSDDLSSVRHYHSALGTLEHLSDRSTGRPAGMPVEPTETPTEMPTDGSEPEPRFYQRPGAVVPSRPEAGEDVGPVRTTPRSSRPLPPPAPRRDAPGSGASLVFEDAVPPGHHAPEAATSLSRMDRAQRHALHSMNRRPRRGLWVTALVVAALVAFGVLALVGSHRSPSKGASATTVTTASAGHTSPTTRGPSHHRTTATSAPAQIVAVSSTAATALYPVNTSAYRLTITASGPCWVDATSASDGTTLWTGTMQAGQVQQIQATGTAKVELGTLAVALDVDGVPVVIPSTVRSPFVLTFQPASSSAGTGTSSTTSTTLAPAVSSTTIG